MTVRSPHARLPLCAVVTLVAVIGPSAVARADDPLRVCADALGIEASTREYYTYHSTWRLNDATAPNALYAENTPIRSPLHLTLSPGFRSS